MILRSSAVIILIVFGLKSIAGDLNAILKDINRDAIKTEIIFHENASSTQQNITVRIGVHFLRFSEFWCDKNASTIIRHDAILHMLSVYSGIPCEVVYVQPVEVNGTKSLEGGYSDLAKGSIDIYLEPLYYRNTVLENVTFLYPHESNAICLLVAKAPLVRRSMLSRVSPTIWLTIAACLLMFVLLTAFRRKLSISFVVLQVIRTFITGSFHQKIRVTMVFLSVLSLFMSNTIAGSFTGSMVSPGHLEELDSLEQVDAAVSHVFVPWWFLSHVKHLSAFNGTIGSLVRKVTTSYRMETLVASRRSAYLSPQFTLSYEEKTLSVAAGSCAVLHRVRECVLSPAFMSFAVRKGWGGAHRFNTLLQRLVEAGLTSKLKHEQFRDAIGRFHSACTSAKDRSPRAPATPLTMQHLRQAFVLWASGTSCSSLVFVATVLLSRFSSACRRSSSCSGRTCGESN